MPHKSPRILVISHTCFRESDSNGRTLGNMLSGCTYEKLAQFYIQNAWPDFKYCDDYFRITDSDVIGSLFQKECGSHIQKKWDVSSAEKDGLRHKKSILKMLIRDAAWSSGLWWKENFTEWLNDIRPNVIILQAGDAPFLFRLAVKIAEKYNAKIIVFNTEGYYFKNHDFVARKKGSLLYKRYIHSFRREYERLVAKASITIYNNSRLQHDFDQTIIHKNTVIHCPASDLLSDERVAVKKNQFVYMGNLGVGRFETLMKVADALESIDFSMQLLIYGKCTADQLNTIRMHPNVQYMGFVSYSEVLSITKSSEYVIHVESFDPYYIEDSKYAFSTKIADCLAYSNNFIVIAPETVASSVYLNENRCALLITNEMAIQESFNEFINTPRLRQEVHCRGVAVAQRNHSRIQNMSQMNIIINQVTDSLV